MQTTRYIVKDYLVLGVNARGTVNWCINEHRIKIVTTDLKKNWIDYLSFSNEKPFTAILVGPIQYIQIPPEDCFFL